MAVAAKRRLAWEDPFVEPELEDLVEVYGRAELALFNAAREWLLGVGDSTEELSWQGLPWRWCLVYTIPGDPTRAWAYLSPDPERPRLAIPFTGEMLQAMPMHRFKRHLKDVFAATNDVGGKFWPTFDVTTKGQLEDVLDLAKRKYVLVTGKRPGAAS